MQCLELQLQMDGIPIKKCQETNKKVMALSMNILVDQNLSVGTNLWIGDVHLVIKKKKESLDRQQQGGGRWDNEGVDQAHSHGD